MSPNRENLNKLADALVSGKYSQGRHALRIVINELDDSKDEHCCLGVACDISNVGRWAGTKRDSYGQTVRTYVVDYVDPFHGPGEETNYSVMPSAVAEWLGISPDGAFMVPGDEDEFKYHLTHLNDQGFTFSQIADILRSEAIIWLPRGL